MVQIQWFFKKNINDVEVHFFSISKFIHHNLNMFKNV
jgi:hypothetical protein